MSKKKQELSNKEIAKIRKRNFNLPFIKEEDVDLNRYFGCIYMTIFPTGMIYVGYTEKTPTTKEFINYFGSGVSSEFKEARKLHRYKLIKVILYVVYKDDNKTYQQSFAWMERMETMYKMSTKCTYEQIGYNKNLYADVRTKGEGNVMKDPETANRACAHIKYRIYTKEFRELTSLNTKNWWNEHPEARLRFKNNPGSHPCIGLHHTEEAKHKMRLKALGKEWSEESRNKLSATWKRIGHPNFGVPMYENCKIVFAKLRKEGFYDKNHFKKGSENIMFEIGENHPLYGSTFTWITKDKVNVRHPKDQPIPEDWIESKYQKLDICITNGIEDVMVNSNDPMPENWWKGSSKASKRHKGSGNPAFGTKLINNLLINKRIPKDDPIPDNWFKGDKKTYLKEKSKKLNKKSKFK